ncbi:hypothetical protein Csa_024004, partial [Cucumis sativus]
PNIASQAATSPLLAFRPCGLLKPKPVVAFLFAIRLQPSRLEPLRPSHFATDQSPIEAARLFLVRSATATASHFFPSFSFAVAAGRLPSRFFSVRPPQPSRLRLKSSRRPDLRSCRTFVCAGLR